MKEKFQIREKVWVMNNGIPVETFISRIDKFITKDTDEVAVYYFTDLNPDEVLEEKDLFLTKGDALAHQEK